MRDVLRDLIRVAGVAVEVREDPQSHRSSSTIPVSSAAGKVRSRCGWADEPVRTFAARRLRPPRAWGIRCATLYERSHQDDSVQAFVFKNRGHC